MTKHYMKEFQDFDNSEGFDKLLNALEPYGFECKSWHNDACPSIGNSVDTDDGIWIFIDYLDASKSDLPEWRESGDLKIYSINVNAESVFQTDDVDAAIKKAIELI